MGIKENIKQLLQMILPSYRVALRIERTLFREFDYKMELASKRQEMMFWHLLRQKGESMEETRKQFFENLPPADGYLRRYQLALQGLLEKFIDICEGNGISYWLDGGNLLGAVRHKGFIPWDDDVDVAMTRSEFNHLVTAIKHSDILEIKYLYDYKNIYLIPKVMYKDGHNECFVDIIIYEEVACENKKMAGTIWNRWAVLQNKLHDDLHKGMGRPAKPEEYMDFLESEDKIQTALRITNQYAAKLTPGSGKSTEGTYLIICMEFPRDLSPMMRCFPKEWIYPLCRTIFENRKVWSPNQRELYLQLLYGDIYSLPNDFGSQRHANMLKLQNRI